MSTQRGVVKLTVSVLWENDLFSKERERERELQGKNKSGDDDDQNANPWFFLCHSGSDAGNPEFELRR